MASVALIGADGAGKTTIANQLLNRYPDKIKYIYMGGNLQSSNLKLPSSRFIVFIRDILKRKSHKDSALLSSLNNHLKTPDEWWTGDNRGAVFAFFRMINRIAEESYRFFISWRYQVKGYVVIYDRHILFEKLRDHNIAQNKNPRLTERLHTWIIQHLYPKPDYIIFLDAPADVLYKRKGETSLEFIEYTREVYLRAGQMLDNFKIINVDQSPENICNEISLIIVPRENKNGVKN